ncbi:hypothetical protein ACFL1R_04785 [Candidatus Latescibacterota bacterium]
MRFSIKSNGPFAGKARLTGDLGLTLSVMAFGMFSPHPVTICNPSPSHEVETLRKYLEQHGTEFNDTEDGFRISGGILNGDITIGNDIPESVVHIIVSGAVFSGQSVRIIDGLTGRIALVEFLKPVLKNTGLTDDYITGDGDDVLINGSVWAPRDVVTVRSTGAFETYCAAGLAARKSVNIAFPQQTVSHSMKLVQFFGYHIAKPENGLEQKAKLARRMSKASGETPLETKCLKWEGRQCEKIVIPGDTTIAAALAGASSVVQKSDIVLENVLWEQGRRGFFEALRRMKGSVDVESIHKGDFFESADLRVRWNKLEGIELSPAQAQSMITELLILGAVAASAHGETVVNDVKNEPGLGRDVFALLSRGLEMLGCHVGDYADGLVLTGGNELLGDLVDSGGRPGLALALTVAGISAAGTTTVFGIDRDIYPVNVFMNICDELSSELTFAD